MRKVIHTGLSLKLEVSKHTSTLKRQPEMSPAKDLRGINNPASLLALTTASHDLIKHCTLLVLAYICTVGAQIEMNGSSRYLQRP